MSFQQQGQLRCYQFELFEGLNVTQGIYTRKGGVSPAPWDSLNMGASVGDDRSNNIENRARMFSAFGRPVDSLFDVWQVHSTTLIVADQPRPLDEPHQKADIIMTNRPEITLFMRFADCVPIFLFDPVQNAISLVHAGWKGSAAKIAAIAVKAMTDIYGCNPQNILAGIGPSIGPDHYEVREDVLLPIREAFNSQSDELFSKRNGKVCLNLWKTNQLALEEAGVRNIQTAEICTACHTDDWFSHRMEHGKTGRFGALFALKTE
jgi:polyphenol oxidase